jgi:hypothetical protein
VIPPAGEGGGYDELLPAAAVILPSNRLEVPMAQSRAANTDFSRAFGDAKKQAGNIAGDAADAAQDIYDQARDSASELADSAHRAARQTADSFGQALRNTIETQPYTAAAIALGLGWLLGRLHRPL